MVARIKASQFYGASKVFTGEPDGMTAVIRDVLRTQARVNLAANVAAITDSSGGSYSAVLPAVPSFVAITEAGSNAVSKSDMDAGFASVNQAFTDLVAQAIKLNAQVPVIAAITNSLAGTPSTTIAAIHASGFTGVSSGTASYSSSVTLLSQYLATARQLVHTVNALAVSTGSPSLNDAAIGAPESLSYVYAVLPVATGASQDGTALQQITVANAEAVFAALANVVASLAHVLNDMPVESKPLNAVAI